MPRKGQRRMEFKRRTNDSAISILELLHQRLARAQRQRQRRASKQSLGTLQALGGACAAAAAAAEHQNNPPSTPFVLKGVIV